MSNEVEMTEVSIEFLHALLDYRREYFKLCDNFSIPLDRRGERWVSDGINERIRTYLTSYVARRSLEERENGAAFTQKMNPLIKDPKEANE